MIRYTDTVNTSLCVDSNWTQRIALVKRSQAGALNARLVARLAAASGDRSEYR